MGLYLKEGELKSEHVAQDKQSHQGQKWSEALLEHTVDAVDNLELRSVRGHGLFHDDIGIYSEDGSGNPVYDFSRSDKIFDILVENDIEPIVELASMPAALAADPSRTVFDWKMIVSPPKDYAKWQALVQAFVQHSVDRYGAEVANSWHYEVWNEPECCSGKFWGGSGTPGTPEEYFQLFDAAAAGVHAVLPEGRVGGPVTSQPSELTGGQWEGGAGVRFLDHITETNGDLGFFSFHTWSFLDGAINGYFQGRDLLDQRGLTDIDIAVTEFGPTWEFGLRGVTSGTNAEPDWEPQETSQGAAFVAQVYADISRRAAAEGKRFPIAYSWWTLSDVFDEGYEDDADYVLEESPFIGAMGLISREGIKKPAYNAYRFLAQMGSQQLPLTVVSPGGVNGLAARDESGGVQVLIYNGQNPGQGFRNDTYYETAAAQPVSVTIEGLDAETAYDVTAYRVDETHGNSFAVWDSQGRPAMSQMDDAAWEALRNGAESPAEPLGQALCGTSAKLNLQLSSPGVLLVTLTPAVAAP
jgi:xylan 1,4-beta-xylosidase